MFSIQQFANSSRLPTLPEIAIRLVEIAQQDEPDFHEVSRIIRADPVVSGKILKTVNSPLFGFRHKVATIEQAVPKLGITLLRTLILSFHLARFKTQQSELEPVLQNLWRSALTQAVFAELIAESLPTADPASCFLAAMLQDIGILAMISETPDDYLQEVLTRTEFPNVAAAERSHYGLSHADVSAEIIRQWGMEASFSCAIRHHHDQVVETLSPEANPFNIVLQAANLGASVLSSHRAAATSLHSELDEWIGFLEIHFGFTAEQANEMISEVNQRVTEYSLLFNFNIGEGAQVDDVVNEAKNMLQEIALKYQLELISQQKTSRMSKRQRDELFRDSLSGIYNRRFMNAHLTDKIARCIKKKRPIALLFLDVDKFKSINDSFGHAVGDQAIKHVADWLTQSIRKDDVAIRLGGDEFLVILQVADEGDFDGIAKRMAKKVPPMSIPDGREVPISISVGCTYYQPEPGDTADANWLIEQADQSMYRAKKAGGDSISIQKFVGLNLASV